MGLKFHIIQMYYKFNQFSMLTFRLSPFLTLNTTVMKSFKPYHCAYSFRFSCSKSPEVQQECNREEPILTPPFNLFLLL